MAKKVDPPKFPEVLYVEINDGVPVAVAVDPVEAENDREPSSFLVRYKLDHQVVVAITAEVFEVGVGSGDGWGIHRAGSIPSRCQPCFDN